MTWEERMSAKAHERGWHHDEPSELTPYDEHVALGHHWHVRANYLVCSCGRMGGVFTVVIDEDFDWDAYEASISCSVCGERGVVADEEPGGEG